jgi:hypothetical protein
MMADLFGRSAYSKTPGAFIPYFQYKIGAYQPDHYLYFPKEPYALRYQNEIFNKLYEYKGYDIRTYLDFHYSDYKDKHDFLRFLQYEIADRLKLKSRKTHGQKLQSTQEWVSEKQHELQVIQEAALKQEIEEGVWEIIGESQAGGSQKDFENATHALSKKLNDHIEQIMISTEERLETLTGSFVTGNIELNNHNHLEKVVQLFILLQTVQAPPQIARAEQLFKRFSATDLASILHLHFATFKNKKINTLQVKIREATERLNPNNPKVQKLTEALEDFFYK